MANDASSPYTAIGGAIDGTVPGAMVDVASLVRDAGWTWAAIAVLAGFLVARTWWVGVAVGVTCLIAASCSYFLIDSAIQRLAFGADEVISFAILSLVTAVVLGPVGYLARRIDLIGMLCRRVVPVGAMVQMLVTGQASAALGACRVHTSPGSSSLLLRPR